MYVVVQNYSTPRVCKKVVVTKPNSPGQIDQTDSNCLQENKLFSKSSVAVLV